MWLYSLDIEHKRKPTCTHIQLCPGLDNILGSMTNYYTISSSLKSGILPPTKIRTNYVFQSSRVLNILHLAGSLFCLFCSE